MSGDIFDSFAGGGVLLAFGRERLEMGTTVMASQQRIPRSPVSVDGEKVCFKGTIVLARVSWAGTLGVLTV